LAKTILIRLNNGIQQITFLSTNKEIIDIGVITFLIESYI